MKLQIDNKLAIFLLLQCHWEISLLMWNNEIPLICQHFKEMELWCFFLKIIWHLGLFTCENYKHVVMLWFWAAIFNKISYKSAERNHYYFSLTFLSSQRLKQFQLVPETRVDAGPICQQYFTQARRVNEKKDIFVWIKMQKYLNSLILWVMNSLSIFLLIKWCLKSPLIKEKSTTEMWSCGVGLP